MSLSPPPAREKLPVDARSSSADMPRVWLKWFDELRTLVLNTAAGIANWADLNFSNSNITDIQTRNHGDLQNLNTADNAHLYLADRDALVGGGVTGLHKHDHSLQDNMNSASYSHLSSDEKDATLDIIGTCLISNCALSINTDTTKFNVAAGILYFADSYTDPTNPTFTPITYAGSTANSVTNLATQDATYVSIGVDGTLYQTATKPVAGDIRDKVLLGALVHTNRTSITSADSNTNVIGFDVPNCLSDISYAIGPINEGNLYSGNVTNTLRIDKSAGYIWQIGINWKNDKKNPNRITAAATTGATHLATWRNGTGGWTTLAKTDVIPNRYDDGTGGATTPSGVLATNKWQAIKIFYLPNSALTGLEYGQQVFNSLAEAEASKSDPTTDNPALSAVPFRGWLLVRGGATDLNNPSDATFIDAGRFGQTTSGAGTGSSTTSLQEAYLNSSQPQITTDATGGAFQVKRGSAADTDAVFQVLNGAGAPVFSVTGERATLTAPALGTPQSGTLTNCTGLPVGGVTMNTARLLGRSTAGSGVAEEITVGSGLSLSGGSLTSTSSIPDLSLTCTQASGALTFAGVAHAQTFRSATLTDGSMTTITADPADLVLPSGGTLGFVTTVQGRIVIAEMNNAGTSEYAICNIAGGLQMDETNLISTTAIGTGSDSANVWYSTTARTNLPYKIVGVVGVVNTAGAWGNPVLVQPMSAAQLAIPNVYDNTGVSVDRVLRIGDKAFIDVSAATSIPLRIATESGQQYKITGALTSTAAAAGAIEVLQPNNTTYASAFTFRQMYGAGTTAAAGTGTTDSAFRIGLGGATPNEFDVTVFTETARKRSLVRGGETTNTVSYVYDIAGEWNDTTTAWTSLGTLAVPIAATGRIVIERVL